MNNTITGIVDSPLKKEDDDKLQMKSFEMALVEFIKKTSTPISIALQGEWGSGKTSLMNRLDMQICQSNDASFYAVWLNTWHYALMNSDKTILFEIIETLIRNVLTISKAEHPEKLKYLIKDVYQVGKAIFKGLSKIAVKSAVSQINEAAGDVISDAVFTDKSETEYSLSDLRNKLSELINELITKNIENGINKKAFIFFIDDLDRIEPSLAVNILELLKNIFDIDHCIFVLAIDYDVVVKGLKSKFGELNEQNEREFRSFFDKIIQLPFQMPLNTYIIDDYIKEMLLSVGFITEAEADDDFIKELVQFTYMSVGSNPRSIKRLTNTLSFINLLIKSKNTLTGNSYELKKYEKQIIYALTCFQTAFPAIFNLLADNPNIENWNDEFARRHDIGSTSLTDDNLLNVKWKQIIFAYCNISPYMKRNFFNIMSMINEMQLIAENNGKTLNQILPENIELLSITNIKADVKPKMEINNIRVLFALNKKLQPALQKKLQEPLKQVERKGRMIAKITYQFDEQKSNNWISIFVFVKHNNLYVKVGNAVELFPISGSNPDGHKNLESRGKTEVFNQIVADYNELNQKYSNFTYSNKPQNGLSVNKQTLVFEQYFQLVSENVEYIYTDKTIDELSSFIIDFMKLTYRVADTDWGEK